VPTFYVEYAYALRDNLLNGTHTMNPTLVV
jgi:hypothetical protein